MGGFLACCACQAASCCVSETCKCCGKVVGKSAYTRVVYAILLFITALVGWLMLHLPTWIKDNMFLSKFIGDCPETVCSGPLATYRILAAVTVFHALLALVMIGVTSKRDSRIQLQNDWWIIKVIVLILLVVAFFFIPNTAISPYGYAALAGSSLFIILQLLLLVDFAHLWNEKWVGEYVKTKSNFWTAALLGVSSLLYLLSIVGSVLMYVYFNENNSGCWINSMFITINLIFCIFFTFLSIYPKLQQYNPRSGLLQSSVVTAFCTFMVFSAIASEPSSMQCSSIKFDNNGSNISLACGIFLSFIAILYSALRSSSTSLPKETSDLLSNPKEVPVITDVEAKPSKEKENDETSQSSDDEQDEVSYSLSFFHVTFALAAMYFAMILTNWQLDPVHASDIVGVDQGTAAVWIKIISSWVTIALYFWTLVAPILLPERFSSV